MSETKQAGSELHWNIMSRFREYVRSTPDGAETWVAEDGGIHSDGLVFTGPEQVTRDDLPWRFRGAVRYEAYRGALRVDISDPEISRAENGYLISVNISPPGVEECRIPLAAGIPDEETGQSCRTESMTLTTEGAALFGGVYQSGEPADGFEVLLRQATHI